jgi:Domain of unknown function (DUF6249)
MGPGPVLIAIVLGVTATLVSVFYLRYRARLDYQKTVRLVIGKGQELTPEFVAGLGEQPVHPNPNRDLRFGVIAIAIGIAIGSFGWIIDDPEVMPVAMGIGNLPLLVGLAMVVLWKFAPRA